MYGATRRRRRGGLFTNIEFPSEPTKAQLAAVTAAVVDNGVEFAPFGMANGVYFANAVPGATESARATDSPMVPLSIYNISVFVIMDAGGAPAPGILTTAGDFCLAIDGGVITTVVVVTQINGNLYRVSGSKACSAAPSISGNGVFRFTTQTGRGFRITGYQVTLGPALFPYLKTTAGPNSL